MPNEIVTRWYSAFDVLREADPTAAAALASSFPKFEDEIIGRRAFGSHGVKDEAQQLEQKQRLGLARATLASVTAAATRSLEEVLRAIQRRARLLARVRLGSGFISTLGSAGVLACLSNGTGLSKAGISALIAMAGSLLNNFVSYFEDQSGGEGSVARLRAAAMDLVGPLAEIRGQIELGLATRDDQSVVAAMNALNATAARLLTLRAKLGLPLGNVLT